MARTMGILRAEWQTRTFGVATHEANMSDDSKDQENEETEPDPDLIDEEMGEEIEIDLEAGALLSEDEDDSDEENKEIPAGARPAVDDDDDDEDDEVEADLDTILKERLSSADDEDDDEEDEEGVITTAEGDRIPGKQEDEILCEGCFLLVKESQYDMRENIASCPHCGTQLNV